ncbi:Hypothetical protein, putative [Bodo saltans]|uniref:Uncharacterized protein n=1 Tax=Bodo saltans TaxID=75058 RepID=A0A0S4IZE9_BODSA|nr:Hypothetical protein, putative [Bodo saltans]|eukprot:CUG05413.1 Hypothetical protein, putative [Bodo saltans]
MKSAELPKRDQLNQAQHTTSSTTTPLRGPRSSARQILRHSCVERYKNVVLDYEFLEFLLRRNCNDLLFEEVRRI